MLLCSIFLVIRLDPSWDLWPSRLSSDSDSSKMKYAHAPNDHLIWHCLLRFFEIVFCFLQCFRIQKKIDAGFSHGLRCDQGVRLRRDISSGIREILEGRSHKMNF